MRHDTPKKKYLKKVRVRSGVANASSFTRGHRARLSLNGEPNNMRAFKKSSRLITSWLWGVVSLSTVAIVLIATPIGVAMIERLHRNHVLLVEQMVMSENAELFYFSPITENSRYSAPVLSQGEVRSAVQDDAFGLVINGACRARRVTEYCQWREVEERHCEKCQRQNEWGETEEYDCRCDTSPTFKYRKGWSADPIAPESFEVKEHQMNPSGSVSDVADLKSQVIVADEVAVIPNSDHNVYARLDSSLLERLHAKWKRVDFSFQAKERDIQPSKESVWKVWQTKVLNFFLRARRHRYSHKHHVLTAKAIERWQKRSSAFTNKGFSYVGHGYFYRSSSPEQQSSLQKKFEAFISSKSDADLMDRTNLKRLFSDCELGDVRLRYEVQAPKFLSVMAVVTVKDPDGNGVDLGDSEEIQALVHAGIRDAEQILRNEAAPQDSTLILGRVALYAWALATASLLAAFFGLDLASRPVALTVVAGSITALFLAAAWTHAYGLERSWRDIGSALTVAVALSSLGFANTKPAKSPSGVFNVWIMLASWAYLHPNWASTHVLPKP